MLFVYWLTSSHPKISSRRRGRLWHGFWKTHSWEFLRMFGTEDCGRHESKQKYHSNGMLGSLFLITNFCKQLAQFIESFIYKIKRLYIYITNKNKCIFVYTKLGSFNGYTKVNTQPPHWESWYQSRWSNYIKPQLWSEFRHVTHFLGFNQWFFDGPPWGNKTHLQKWVEIDVVNWWWVVKSVLVLK